MSVVLIGLFIVNSIFFAKAFRDGTVINRVAAGQLGDFVGGYIGTIFMLLSVVLLYSTLKNQRSNYQSQMFELRYFELLKLHRDNVSELELKSAKGRKIFVLLLREFREILKIVKEKAKETNLDFPPEKYIEIAYYCLFYGTGPNSTRMLKDSLSKIPCDFVDALVGKLSDESTKQSVKKNRNFEYVPFEGHQSRLGHYYRHLYQTVCYVNSKNFLSFKEKYDYVKTVRAQLSTHEQAMFLLNSLTPTGNAWWKYNLMLDYKLVKNVPQFFFDEDGELDITGLFPESYFEWQND